MTSSSMIPGKGFGKGEIVSVSPIDVTITSVIFLRARNVPSGRRLSGGSLSEVVAGKICKVMDLALKTRAPVIGLIDSGGARIQEGNKNIGFDTIFYALTQASGVIPLISVILGTCAGNATYAPALCDFTIMVEGISNMFITGPQVIKEVTGVDVTIPELGGTKVHCRQSGVADFRVPSEDECFKHIRRLLGVLPSNHRQPAPVVATNDDPLRLDDKLTEIVPPNPFTPFDVRLVIQRLVDNGDFLEVKPEFAAEMVVGFGRMAGQTVGFVANQSLVKAGSLTIDSSDKQARFMRLCDSFNIPIVLLVDTPAYFPGSEQEHAGIIRHGAKVLYAMCEAVVPRISVIMRRLYGGGTLGMGVVPGLNTDLVYAWPTAEIGFFGSEQIVDFFYGEEIKKMADATAFRQQKIKEYKELYTHPLAVAQDSTIIHDVIEPRETRRRLIQSLELLKTKRVRRQPKRHGNIPL